MAQVEKINPDWQGEPCIVAAPGPSLTTEVANTVRMTRWLKGWRVIAVQDAYRLMPWADAVYGCDDKWWNIHQNCGGFEGEKWSTHEAEGNDKLKQAELYGLRLVAGRNGSCFSTDPGLIHYGSNSGFQAINLAILKGCTKIVLVGFDMRAVGGKRHFFGDHPKGLFNRTNFEEFIPKFIAASKAIPNGVRIINATPDSALTCFKVMPLEAAIADDSVLRHGAVDHGAASTACAG